MRILHLLLIGISISLAAALAKTEINADSKTLKTASTKKTTTTTTTQTAAAANNAKPAAVSKAKSSSSTRQSKDLKAAAANERRGKRTLYDFDNAGYLYPDILRRRNGYDNGYTSEARAYYPSENGYYNGQNAVAQYPVNFGAHYGHYPQYLEAPEPIIEIIIKDSNETLQIPAPSRKTKKKKEKVHVFYVNYKKDANNKLLLESPIASLNNDDEATVEEDELEEDIGAEYPSAVTALPPVKSTTLRTIIHPDSEKFHSNSGIHVSFGSEDKSQTGHILEENDAESVQSPVVAVPIGGGVKEPIGGFKSLTESYFAHTRADFGVGSNLGRSPPNSLQSSPPFQQPQNFYHAQQQLPAQYATNYFRSPQPSVPAPTVATPPHFYQKQQPQQQQQQQQYQQRPTFNQLPQPQPQPQQQLQPQAQALQGKFPPAPQQQVQQPVQHQSLYYSNFNQQFPQQQRLQQSSTYNQYYRALPHKPNQTPKQPVSLPQAPTFFPTVPSKLQELPSRQAPSPYQPIKFRPTPVPTTPIKPIPAKLENSHFQVQHYQQQPQQHQQQQQQQQHFSFNRQQQQFVQTSPNFALPTPSQQPNYYKPQAPQYQPQQQQQQYPQQQQYQQQQQQQHSINHKLQSQPHKPVPTNSLPPSTATPSLSSLNSFLNIAPSRETELLQSIPKFEQHITETIHHQPQQQQQSSSYNQYSFNQPNQVIHDIPAPNLGPTLKPGNQQSVPAALGSHYITSTNLQHSANTQQQQYTNFVTTPHSDSNNNQLYTTTTAVPQYERSTDGQKIMIVTPMPPTSGSYTQYQANSHQQQQQPQQQQPQQQQPQQQQYQQQQQQQPQQQQQYQQQLQTQQPQQQYQQQQQYSSQQQSTQQSNTQWTNNFAQQPRQSTGASPIQSNVQTHFGVSTYHSDVFKELEQRKHALFNEQQHQEKQNQQQQQQQQHHQQHQQQQQQQQQHQQHQNQHSYKSQSSITSTSIPTTTTSTAQSTPAANNPKAKQTLLQLPDEVPDDLRQQLLSSGILSNADISVLDYDKVGDVALENLPAEHLQHFYGAGGGAQISESNRVLTVVKPNGDSVALNEKDLEHVKESNSLPQRQPLDVKVVRFDANNEKSVTDKYIRSDATVVPPVDLADRQYNRYLPLKINGAQFPLPDVEELRGKKIVSVVVLAPVEPQNSNGETHTDGRTERDAADAKEVKFLGGDLIKTLVKKPTKENFKRWLEKEARNDVEQQSVVLLVAKSSDDAEQEIFMYDIVSGAINKLNGDLSSAFVSVAEENASSEDLEHASTLDPSFIETMMQKNRR